jgi:hypothetical protein
VVRLQPWGRRLRRRGGKHQRNTPTQGQRGKHQRRAADTRAARQSTAQSSRYKGSAAINSAEQPIQGQGGMTSATPRYKGRAINKAKRPDYQAIVAHIRAE